MSEPTRAPSILSFPKAEEIAEFVHLHLDTVAVNGPHPKHEGEYIYQVEGKPRPMLVLSRLDEERGQVFFLVLPITKVGYVNGKLRKRVEPIGDCITPGVQSYVLTEPCRLPANMLHCAPGQSPIRRLRNRFAFLHAIKKVQDRVLHATESSPLGIED
ncbi:MAG: hypothetical protein WCJ35_25800 [Planctomycetota bacterium]